MTFGLKSDNFWKYHGTRIQWMFRKLDTAGVAVRLALIFLDGVQIWVEEGEPIAAVLLRAPPFTARATPVSGGVRAPYCMMGACFECLVEIDGETSRRSCMTPARNGMVVRRQTSRPDPNEGAGA